MNIKKTGDFIAKCRKEKGMTQKQLADCIGVTDKSISKYERGINLPESSLFIPLCECLEIEVEELLLGEHIKKEQLKQESKNLLIDLSTKDKVAYTLYKSWMAIILLPVLFFYIAGAMDGIDGRYVKLATLLLSPFTFTYGLLKAIECIKYEKSYFRYFLLISLTLFFLLLCL